MSLLMLSSEKNLFENEKQSGFVCGEYVPTKLYESVIKIGELAVDIPVDRYTI